VPARELARRVAALPLSDANPVPASGPASVRIRARVAAAAERVRCASARNLSSGIASACARVELIGDYA
jgi:hypothetical protein